MTDVAQSKDDVIGRELSVRNYDGADALLKDTSWPNHRFVCLLAWDSKDVSGETIAKVARHLIRNGCVYICAWGPGCERVHDIFDEADLELNPEPPWTMSTWHADEPLFEAMWFALNSAVPDDALYDDCNSVIGMSLANKAWASEIREAFECPGKFNERVLGAE